MGEIKSAWRVYATAQGNYGDQECGVKVFDKKSEAKNKFKEYVKDFVIGVIAERNMDIYNNDLYIDPKEFFILGSPNFGFEIEYQNGIYMDDIVEEHSGLEKNTTYVIIDDEETLALSSNDEEITKYIKEIEKKYKNVRFDRAKDKYAYLQFDAAKHEYIEE